MPIYNQSAITAKEGVNYVRGIVEGGGSLFLKIEQENDLGIDAILEFIENGHPLNTQIAVQVKSGATYYNAKSKECVFPIRNHRAYWAKYPLPVFGIVYVPALGEAYWVNIKSYMEENKHATVVRFAATEVNKFVVDTFNSVFLPAMVGKIPTLSFEKAHKLSLSLEPSEFYLGLFIMFRRYVNRTAVWDQLVRVFVDRPVSEIPPELLYWLAHIPGHGDIFHYGETPSADTREYARILFTQFGVSEVKKLLSFIDPEEQIGRGTLGQSIEAIVSSLPYAPEFLRKIISESEVEMPIRESAALILAMNEAESALSELSTLEKEGSWYAGEIARHVRQYKEINPYA